jgi:hypothetical protein
MVISSRTRGLITGVVVLLAVGALSWLTLADGGPELVGAVAERAGPSALSARREQVSQMPQKERGNGDADTAANRTEAVVTRTFRDLEAEHGDLLGYFNRMLQREGLSPVPGNASIRCDDVPAFLEAVAVSRQEIRDLNRSWSVAVGRRTDHMVQDIADALRAGKVPAYPVLARGEGVPSRGAWDKVGVHTPAGSGDRYLLEFPSSDFPSEVGALREALLMQSALFRDALRHLFSQ